MLENTISTKDIINYLDGIVKVAQNGAGSVQTDHTPETRYKPRKSAPWVILSGRKSKFPRSRDRAKRSPLSNKTGNGLTGVNTFPITPSSPLIWKYGQSLLKRSITRVDFGWAEARK